MSENYLSRYELLEEIGRGNMGVVYKARDPEIDRILAIKVVRLGFSLDDAQAKTFLERFRREAKIAGNLLHPHIVGVYDIDFSGDEPFIAMEYFPGIGSLAARRARAFLDDSEVRLIVRQLASALDYAHGEGVVHRDIKPANVLYQPGPMIKLVDFGIAKVEALELTATGELIGTPSYMSPEIFSGETVDGRSDLFSLGVILYLLLTGERPFEAVDGQPYDLPRATRGADAAVRASPRGLAAVGHRLRPLAREKAARSLPLGQSFDRATSTRSSAEPSSLKSRRQPIEAEGRSRWRRLVAAARRHRVRRCGRVVVLAASRAASERTRAVAVHRR